MAHTNWLNRPTFVPWTKAEDQQATVIHEYAHGWQHVLGCISLFDQPLGNWLNEGIAQYVGFQALIAQGAMQAAAVLSFMLSSAKSTGALDKPLEELAPLSSQPWPGHVGYIALDMLVEDAPEGKLAVRTICEEVASGAAVFDAFESAFGIPLAEFYAEFEVWRQSQ